MRSRHIERAVQEQRLYSRSYRGSLKAYRAAVTIDCMVKVMLP